MVISYKVLKSVKTIWQQIWDGWGTSHEVLGKVLVWWAYDKETKITFHLSVVLKTCEGFRQLNSIRVFFFLYCFYAASMLFLTQSFSFTSVKFTCVWSCLLIWVPLKRIMEPELGIKESAVFLSHLVIVTVIPAASKLFLSVCSR